MWYFQFSERPEKVFHIISDDGDSYFVKSQIPAISDFPDNEDAIREWGQFLCKLFADYSEQYPGDISHIIYRVYIHLSFFQGNMMCSIWSDDVRPHERERIGKQIRDLRLSKNMEAKKLAELTGINAANISKIEQGKYSVGYDILAKIALALGARIELVPYDDQPNNE